MSASLKLAPALPPGPPGTEIDANAPEFFADLQALADEIDRGETTGRPWADVGAELRAGLVGARRR